MPQRASAIPSFCITRPLLMTSRSVPLPPPCPPASCFPVGLLVMEVTGVQPLPPWRGCSCSSHGCLWDLHGSLGGMPGILQSSDARRYPEA